MKTLEQAVGGARRETEQHFVERTLSLETQAPQADRGVIIAIQGPSGIGKTHLIDKTLHNWVRTHRALYTRIDAPQQFTHLSFRSIVLKSVLRQYTDRLEAGEDLSVASPKIISVVRRKHITAGASAVLDGLTLGGATALRSLYELIKTRSSTALDDVVLDDLETDETIDALFADAGREFSMALAVSNAQRLTKKDLTIAFSLARTWRARLVLEYTMPSFDQGVIERETLSELAIALSVQATAMTLGPLPWADAYRINSALMENDQWAKDYYERHGYNLFDLRNLVSAHPERPVFEEG